jgi:hypothetical protein
VTAALVVITIVAVALALHRDAVARRRGREVQQLQRWHRTSAVEQHGRQR